MGRRNALGAPLSADLTLLNLASDPLGDAPVLPLGSLHLAATLEAAGYDVELRDIQLLPTAKNRYGAPNTASLRAAMETDAPVLGISVMSDRMAEAVFALRAFREDHPDTLILIGGAGPTEVAGPLLRRFPHIDAVARGEGEDTVVEAMARFRAGGRAALAGVAGLSVRLGEEVVEGPERPRIRDPDRLPWPERCRWDLSPYPDAALITARGCPYRCSFCSIVSLWGQTMGYRDIERVVDEIAWHQAMKPGAPVHIEDDTFTVHPRRVLDFCAALERRGLEVRWGCTARLDRVEEPLIQRMAAAGCRSLFLGIEAGSDEVRGQVLKRFSGREVFERVALLLRHLESVTCHYIWGYPFESLSDFYETFLHIGALAAMGARPRHSHLVPFPRAPLVAQHAGPPRFRERYPFPRLFLLDPAEPWLDEVRAAPEVFLPYFHLDTPNLEEKFAFVAEYARLERDAAPGRAAAMPPIPR